MNQLKRTPMLDQYLSVKAEHPDALLFFRMGDFYEMFFEDAQIAARELQLALTSRNPNADQPVPMCGVPYHATEPYLTQLLEKGYKVAICDQIEDPRQAKGLVKRAVTRVLTPGTVVEDLSLQANTHNFLAALFWDGASGGGGLTWIDFSTGEWSGLYAKREAELWQWAMKITPRELLLPDGHEAPEQFADLAQQITRLPERGNFDLQDARDKLLKSQSAPTLAVLGLEDKPELVRACGALINYLRLTQKQESLDQLGEFSLLQLGRHLIIDEITERNLEIFRRLDGKTGPGTLRHVVDQTMTPMGGRMLEERLRQPWREIGPIEESLDTVQHYVTRDERRDALRSKLSSVYDIERLSTRIFLNRAMPKDFIALRQSLAVLPDIQGILRQGDENELPTALRSILKSWDNLDDLADLLNRALVDSPPPLITEGGLFRGGYDRELDDILELCEHGEAKMQELLADEQARSGLPRLRLGFNRVFGYYLELSKSQADKIPDHFIRRQTLANGERFVTPALKELEERLLSASDKRKTLEYNLFQGLREIVASARQRFQDMARSIALLDVWQGLATVARKWDWTRPSLGTGLAIRIKEGRHPVVEAVQGAAYIPNDLMLDEERRILLITGPNMAGKSTVLRQAAIIALLAQIGSFVPAREAEIGMVDRIFSRVGASDNLAQGQSTFMVEMTETARILRQAGKRSLVILDEIGRGTSTFDGLSLAWAVMEELAKRHGGIRTLFATHYHELTSLEGKLPGVRNMNIAVKEWHGTIVFLRRLVPGPSDRSYGIEVARLAGVPQAVVARAKEILADLERRAKGAAALEPTVKLRQTLLPGMPVPSSEPEPQAEHPLVEELRRLPLDEMTPLEALKLLHDWKTTFSGKS